MAHEYTRALFRSWRNSHLRITNRGRLNDISEIYEVVCHKHVTGSLTIPLLSLVTKPMLQKKTDSPIGIKTR